MILTANVGVADQHSCVVLPLPVPLQGLHRSTAINLKQAIGNVCRLPFIRELQTCDPGVFSADMSACDRASADNVAEDSAYADFDGLSRLRMRCHAHIAASAQGRGFASADGDHRIQFVHENDAIN